MKIIKEETNLKEFSLELKEGIIREFKEIKKSYGTFRIYKWEDKPFRWLLNELPEGFRLAEFQEFNRLIEDGFEMEINKEHLVKHFNKLQWDKCYYMSEIYLDPAGNLISNLAEDISCESSRVVLIKQNDGEE